MMQNYSPINSTGGNLDYVPVPTNRADEDEAMNAHKQPHFPVPTDRFNAVYILFYLLGIGSLLPWNFFVMAKPYFQYKMRNVTSDNPQELTSLQLLFENYLIIASNIPNVAAMVINVLLTRVVSLKVRMTSSCVAMIAIFVLTDILTLLNTDTWQSTFYALTMLGVVISNAGQSMYCGALFGLSSVFPPRYMAAAMTGQGLGGSLAAIANILSVVVATDVQTRAVAFFFAATFIVILCLVAYMSLYYVNFSCYYIQRHSLGIATDTSDTDNDNILADTTDVEYSSFKHSRGSLVSVLKTLCPFIMTVFMVFTVTLAIYPVIGASVVSVSRKSGTIATNDLFSPLVCFLMFNFADFCGRQIAPDLQCIKSYNTRILFILSVLRFAFIPLFLYCNIEHTRLTVVFGSDLYPVFFTTLMGITNGYLSTLAMMYGPVNIPLPWAEVAGGILALSISVGLATGSALSLGLVSLTQFN